MSASQAFDVDIVLFAQSEGNALGASVQSIRRAVKRAEEQGMRVRLHAILHSPNALTRRCAEAALNGEWHVQELRYSSLSEARNAGREAVQAAHGAFIDGCDLWSAAWLVAALEASRRECAVWRPEFLLESGEDFHNNFGYRAFHQAEAQADPSVLLVHEALPSGFVARQDVFSAHPWPKVEFVDEAVDGWWNCNVAALGLCHRVVEDSFHYRRVQIQCSEAPLKPGQTPIRIGATPLANVLSPRAALGRGASIPVPVGTNE